MSVHDNFDLAGFLKSKKLLKENQESGEAQKWDNLEDEMKWELLLTAIKDPKEAEKYIEMEWNNLPPEVTQNIDWSVESAGQEVDEGFQGDGDDNDNMSGFRGGNSYYFTKIPEDFLKAMPENTWLLLNKVQKQHILTAFNEFAKQFK